jgi:hypothetical protein
MGKNPIQEPFKARTDMIIHTIQRDKPSTTKQLLQSIRQQAPRVDDEEVLHWILSLQKRGLIELSNHDARMRHPKYLLTSKATWFWITSSIIALTVFTILVPTTFPPIIRQCCGLLFVLYLPGFALLKIVRPEPDFSVMSRIALSVGVSIGLTALVVMPLLFFPLQPTSLLLTLILAALTLTLSSIAVKVSRKTSLEVGLTGDLNSGQERE